MTRVRVIHSQTTEGPLLLNDVEDGMPREPFAYLHEQQVYIPREDPDRPGVPGFTDLVPSDKVLASLEQGVIAGLEEQGYVLTPVLISDADLAAPTVAGATLSGTLTLGGANLLSVAPDVSSLVITGAGATTLTLTDITTGGGAFTNTVVVVPSALIPGVSASSSSAAVEADRQTSAAVVIA